MATATPHTEGLRARLEQHSAQVQAVLDGYGARNPRLFGSVARGDATDHSDIDLLVDLDPEGGNTLLRVAGMSEELSLLLGVSVDVVSPDLLRAGVSAAAHEQAVSL